MRQNASDLVRRAEAGEQVTITVAGRPAAVLGPIAPRTWRRWDDVADLFREPIDPDWDADRDLVDASVADPWEADARATRLARLGGLAKRFDPLSVDESVVDSYGRLAARFVDSGRKPRGRVMDLLIAATAHAHQATLYTRNPEDLAGLDDLIDIVTV